MALNKIINLGDEEIILYNGQTISNGEEIVLARNQYGFPLLIVDSDGNLKIKGEVSRL